MKETTTRVWHLSKKDLEIMNLMKDNVSLADIASTLDLPTSQVSATLYFILLKLQLPTLESLHALFIYPKKYSL